MTFLDATDATPLGELGRIGKTGYAGAMNDSGGQVSLSVPVSKVRVDVAAKLIGVSATTVQRLWHAGAIEGERAESGFKELWLTLPSVLAHAERLARMERSRLALKQGRVGDVEFEDADLLTAGEVAALLGVQRQTVSAWIRRQRLAGVRHTSGGNARIEFGEVSHLSKSKGKTRT